MYSHVLLFLSYVAQKIKETHKNESLSDLYGAEHLLRLFVKLPVLLAQTKLEGKEMTVLHGKVMEFLRYGRGGGIERAGMVSRLPFAHFCTVLAHMIFQLFGKETRILLIGV